MKLKDKAAGYSNLCAGYALLRMWDEALPHCNTAIELDKKRLAEIQSRDQRLCRPG